MAQQVNTFTNGMNIDADINMISNNQYRYAQNVKISSDDSSTYGALTASEFIKRYGLLLPSNEIIIGTGVVNKIEGLIDNIGLLFTRTINLQGQYLYNTLYKLTNLDNTIPTLTVVFKADLNLCPNNEYMSIVTNFESVDNIKVYFTDGLSQIKLVNIADVNRYTVDLADSNGVLLDNTLLDTTPGAVLPPFELQYLTVGSLPVGMVQYCYQLFNVRSNETATSALCGLIHLTQSNSNSDYKDYKGSTADTNSGKACVLESTITNYYDKCRIIRILYKTNNSTPEIQIIDEIQLTKDDSLTFQYIDNGSNFLSELTIEQFNLLTGYQFTAKSITKLDNRLFAANIQESTWDVEYDARAYRSNGAGTVRIESANNANTLEFSHLDYDMTTIPKEHDCINPFNILKPSEFTVDNQYVYSNHVGQGPTVGGLPSLIKIKGGSGPNVSYTFATIDIELERSSYSHGLAAKPHIDVPATIDSMYVKNDLMDQSHVITYPIDTPYLHNYADPWFASKYKGYQRDEVYRFGVVFYNKKGIASPVHWIGDIRMPHASDNSPFEVNVTDFGVTATNYHTIGKALGIQFNLYNIPTYSQSGIVGFEIVRCDRTELDRTVLVQSTASLIANYRSDDKIQNIGGDLEYRPLITLTYSKGAYSDTLSNEYISYASTMSWPTTDYVISIQKENISTSYVQLISPEICINADATKQLIGNDSYFDSLLGLASIISPVYTTNPRIAANAGKYLKYDNTYVNTTTTNNKYAGSMKSVTSFAEAINRNVNALSITSTSGDQLIMKYYVPFTTNKISDVDYNIGKIDKNITKTIVAADMPYNGIIDKSPYYTNIGDIVYLNFSSTFFNEGGFTHGGSKIGQHGPVLIANIPNMTTDIKRFGQITNTIGSSTYTTDQLIQCSLGSILLGNIKKQIVPYGGNTYTSRQNSIYISTGSYKFFNLTQPASNYLIDTFGGDTYIGILDYPVTMQFQHKDIAQEDARRIFVVAYIPFETTVNLNLTYGAEAHRTVRNTDYFIQGWSQTNITQIQDLYSQDKPYYEYNGVYSTQSTTKTYVPKDIYSLDDVHTANRIVCSEAKTTNEVTDNWTKFKFANYIDIDNQYGAITNMKAFNNRLLFWQASAFGVASVNDRSLIQDNNIGTLTLGTGGILDRYDYISTTNGNSTINAKDIVYSDRAVYWYDFNKNTILQYTNNVDPISKSKGIQTYLNKLKKTNRDSVIALYDIKYNDIWFTFGNKSLIFSEQSQYFTNFNTHVPQETLQFSDRTITIKDNLLHLISGDELDIDNLQTVEQISKVVFAINSDSLYTKVYDNVEVHGYILNGDDIVINTNDIMAKFATKSQTSIVVDSTDIDYREDSYRFYVPRQYSGTMLNADEYLINTTLYDSSVLTTNETYEQQDTTTFAPRMRGKYMVCEYTLNTISGITFAIPYITTFYRISAL